MKSKIYCLFMMLGYFIDLVGQVNPCNQVIIPADSTGIFAFSGYNVKKGMVDSLCLHIPVEYSFAVKIPKGMPVLPIGKSLQHLPVTLKYSCYPVDCQFKQNEINAFPNPFTDYLQIHILTELSGIFDLQLFDINGRLVERRRINLNPGNNRFEFPTKDIPSGVFACSLTDGFSTVSMRLSKQ